MKLIPFLFFIFFTPVFGCTQDFLIKHSGDSIPVKIQEIGLTEIKYKNYSDLQGITYGILKSEVLRVRYESGQVDYFFEGEIAEHKSDEEKCLCGRMDAEKFHGKREEHFLYGMVFGLTAIAVTAATKQTPYNGRLTERLSQNKQLFKDPIYLKCYGKKAKQRLMENEIGGLAVKYAIFAGIIYYAFYR